MSGSSELTATAPAAAGLTDDVRRSFEGRPAAPPATAPDAVGPAMIRHFADAVGDTNPVYVDDAEAQASGRAGIVAPAAMLQVWTMPTLRQKLAADAALAAGRPAAGSGLDELRALLAGLGFTAIVATNSEQEYRRDLVVGDRVSSTSVIEEISPAKRTALGPGHFVTTRTEYRDAAGEIVGTMLFRMLLYRPEPRGEPPGPGAPGRRPRPIVTPDNAFFFEGLAAGEIRIQRCIGCGDLRHPPRPRCSRCGSYEWGHVVASGRGRLHSLVVVHHPRMPGFEYPLPVGLVELEEGVRLVAELAGADPAALAIGTELAGEVVPVDDELSVPRFRPAAAHPPAPGAGGVLPVIEVPLTRTLIVAGALATRDFQDVHHDPELAHAHGAPDIFMNIITTGGYVGRIATDWAGPAAVVERIAIRLGAPNYAGDTMRLSAAVVESAPAPGPGAGSTRLSVSVLGENSLGRHVTGRVELHLPAGAPAPSA